jgi:hypothetical protein
MAKFDLEKSRIQMAAFVSLMGLPAKVSLLEAVNSGKIDGSTWGEYDKEEDGISPLHRPVYWAGLPSRGYNRNPTGIKDYRTYRCGKWYAHILPEKWLIAPTIDYIWHINAGATPNKNWFSRQLQGIVMESIKQDNPYYFDRRDERNPRARKNTPVYPCIRRWPGCPAIFYDKNW